MQLKAWGSIVSWISATRTETNGLNFLWLVLSHDSTTRESIQNPFLQLLILRLLDMFGITLRARDNPLTPIAVFTSSFVVRQKLSAWALRRCRCRHQVFNEETWLNHKPSLPRHRIRVFLAFQLHYLALTFFWIRTWEVGWVLGHFLSTLFESRLVGLHPRNNLNSTVLVNQFSSRWLLESRGLWDPKAGPGRRGNFSL